MNIPEGMTPEKLLEVAEMLDLFDELLEHYAPSVGLTHNPAEHTGMQDDLRQWAAVMSTDPLDGAE